MFLDFNYKNNKKFIEEKMDFLPTEKILFNNNNYDKEENTNGIDELLVGYEFSWCECPMIAFIIFFSTFPLFLFALFGIIPYKQIIVFDENQKTIIYCERAALSCCNLISKTCNLKNIRKIRIYVGNKIINKKVIPNTNVINCDVEYYDDKKEILFKNMEYKKETYDKLIIFFEKHNFSEDDKFGNEKDGNDFIEEKNKNDINTNINSNELELNMIDKKI